MTTTTSYSNVQGTVRALASTSSSTVLADSFPWLVPHTQGSPQVEVSVSDVTSTCDGELGDDFASFSDISDDLAAATWEATSEVWPEY